MLAVIENQQADSALQRGGQRSSYLAADDASTAATGVGHGKPISHRRQFENQTRGKFIGQACRDLGRQGVLAHPPTPVNVTNRWVRSALPPRRSDSRPMKLVA